MSKVVFQADRKYYAVPYEHLFKCGTDILALANLFHFDGGCVVLDKKHFFGSEEEWERLQALPDWKNAGRSYIFASGKGCNELVLEDPVVIKAMRAYAKTTDNVIVEIYHFTERVIDDESDLMSEWDRYLLNRVVRR